MSNIIDLSIQRKDLVCHSGSSLSVLTEMMPQLYDDFSVKWPIKTDKSDWVAYWASVLYGAGVDFSSVDFAARFCLEQEDVLPTVFYFAHVCALQGDFNRLGKN